MKNVWTHDGDFVVTKDMISSGRFIKGKIPTIVTGNFSCVYNNLMSLEGGPIQTGGYFNCSENKLTTLEGGPAKVGRDFDCDNNNLISLKGGPKDVGRDFNSYNNKLTTLEGGPVKVGGYLDCSFNKLISLEGGPIKIVGRLYCDNNINDLKTETEFLKSGSFKQIYYPDLLDYCINKHIKLDIIESWPENFLTDNVKKSYKGVRKFKL